MRHVDDGQHGQRIAVPKYPDQQGPGISGQLRKLFCGLLTIQNQGGQQLFKVAVTCTVKCPRCTNQRLILGADQGDCRLGQGADQSLNRLGVI